MPLYWVITDEAGGIIGLYLNREDAHEDVEHEAKQEEWTVQGFEVTDRPQWPTWRKREIERLQNSIIKNADEIERLETMGKLAKMPNKHRRLRHEIRMAHKLMQYYRKEIQGFRLKRNRVFADSPEYDPGDISWLSVYKDEPDE